MSDIVEIKRALSAQAQSAAAYLLPKGRREGHEWRAGSVDGDAGKSLGVHLSGEKAGVWKDFGSDEGGDLIDLWMATRKQDLPTALDDIRRWLGMERPKPYSAPQQSWKRPSKPKCTTPEGRAFAYLTEDRNIPADVLAAYRVGEDDKGAIIFPFLLPDGTLALAKRRDSVDGAKPVPTAADCEPILFGWQAMPVNARAMVITEGEIDALSWAAYGYHAMSVPFGGGGGNKQRWIEYEFDRLQRFERIYLATDNDEQGDKAADEIITRLGVHRCLRVTHPGGRKDGNQCLVEGVPKATMDEAIASAAWVEEPSLRRPSEFYDDVVALYYPEEGRHVGYRTPFGSLGNSLVFRPGELTVWTGDAGSGKTQAVQYCSIDAIQQGSRVCILSLEMHPKRTLERMMRQVVGTSRPTKAAIKAALDWLSTGLLMYGRTGKQSLDEILRIFAYARARYGCDQFIVDSLMRLGVAGDDYNTQEAVIFRLVEWTMAANVHTHLVAHSKKGERDRGAPETGDIKGAMEIGANAFNIISVWRDRKFEEQVQTLRESPDGHAAAAKLFESRPGVVLNIAKQRNGDFEGKVGLWFDQATYRYRSRADGASWKRSYLPEGWQQQQQTEARQ
ncbi:MAG: toprim domain-containing protein [Enhydrobacter sp.]|nr:toprim domain-containing protein [Enhydrobacter sp.]